MKYIRLVLIVALLGVMSACGTSQEALLLDAIITAASGIAAVALPPADAQSILTYRGDVLTIVNDLLTSGTTVNGIQQAIISLQNLPLPGVSAQGQMYLSIITTAVQNFIAASGTASPITAAEAKKLKVRIVK